MFQSKDRVADWRKKQKPTICHLQETTLGQSKHIYWKLGDGKKYFMPMDKTGKQELQYSYQIKQILKWMPWSSRHGAVVNESD